MRQETKISRSISPRLAALGAVVFGVLAAPTAMANPPTCPPDAVVDVMSSAIQTALDLKSQRLIDEVNASNAQAEVIEDAVAGAGAQIAESRAAACALRESLHDALQADTLDPDEIEDIRQQLLDLADEASGEAVSRITSVAAVLTPAQREAIADAMSNGPFGGHGPGAGSPPRPGQWGPWHIAPVTGHRAE